MKSRFLVALLGLAGCTANSTKEMRPLDMAMATCLVDGECNGGRCLPSPKSGNSWCANSDGSCASVLKWAPTAGDGLAGMCVAPADAGAPADLLVVDQSQPANQDMTVLGCGMLINCINGCNDQGCRQDCYNDASVNAQQEYMALFTCLTTTCPSAKMGDPCFTQGNTCTQCYTDAQTNGACAQQSQTCSNN